MWVGGFFSCINLKRNIPGEKEGQEPQGKGRSLLVFILDILKKSCVLTSEHISHYHIVSTLLQQHKQPSP